MADNKKVCVISIGSVHISACIAEMHSPDKIEILGMSHTQNKGMLRGQIDNMEKIIAGIKHVVSYAENMADCRVHTAWVCVSSPDLKSFNCTGSVSVEMHVNADDIVRTLTCAKKDNLADDDYLLNHFQHGISVNGSEELTSDPLGMIANQIEGFYHLMTLPIHNMHNIEQIMQASNIHIERTLLSNIANSSFALLADEKEHGVCLVDIGGGTTSISVYVEDKLILTHCIAVGGCDVTRDIAKELKVSIEEAERIKVTHGRLNIEDIDLSKMLNIPAKHGMQAVSISLRELSEIVIARYEEIMLTVMDILNDAHIVPMLQRGIVYSGGGSRIYNFNRFAVKITTLPAQSVTFPPQIMIAKERQHLERYFYQTVLGALIYSESEDFARSVQSEPPIKNDNIFYLVIKAYNKLINFFKNIF